MNAYAEVIGDPIEHSLSPAIHRFWLGALGLDGDYRAARVGLDELERFLDRRRADPDWRGCNVTAPLKERVERLVDRVDPVATQIGAVNCIYRNAGELIGANTDIDGIAEALAHAELEGRIVTVIGSGGAARAAMHYLARRLPNTIRVVARTPGRAKALADLIPASTRLEIHSFDNARRGFLDAAVVVNASPLGMAEAPDMPRQIVDALGVTAGDATVFDMTYRPATTAFLAAARARELSVVGGLTMLIGQADPAFRYFFRKAPPRDRDIELGRLLSIDPLKRPIVLVGMPGAGKTTVGRILARHLGLKFVDSDQEIERSAGITISEYFELHGEAAFREIERRAIAELVSGNRLVIAVGGGALSDDTTWQLVRSRCTTVWLQASLPTLAARLQAGSPRPRYKDRDLELALTDDAIARGSKFAASDIRICEGSPEETAKAIALALKDEWQENRNW